jgi:hypothetical protein
LSTKPNYRDLLAQIARENDPVEKRRLIDLCYQFIFDDITEDDTKLFGYVEEEYVVPNPGEDASGVFSAYVGLYYSDEGETT